LKAKRMNQPDGHPQSLTECQEMLGRCFEALFAKEHLSYMGGFTQGLIHNINGPMQNMSMLVELLLVGQDRINQFVQARCAGDPDKWMQIQEKQKQRLQQMSGQINALTEMLRDFMLINEMERNESEVDLNLAVSKLIHALRADLFFKHQVELELRLTTDLPLIRVTARHLIPSLVHLFQNAMSAMQDVPEKRLVVETRYDGGCVRLSFTDTGCGFTAEQEAHLFEPFFTGWPPAVLTHTRQERHFGLGLYTVRALLSAYGVKVALERIGHETLATLEIPVNQHSSRIKS
jgi:signal transduction histidine kinase